MLTEDYISFEVAKLLKEKGFDWEWSPFYSEQDRDGWFQDNNYNIPNPDYDASLPFDSETINVIAPHVSLQMAMKWLREVHDKNIILDMVPLDEDCYVLWTYNVYCSKNYKIMWGPKQPKYNTYEEACEEAIKYCLEHLI